MRPSFFATAAVGAGLALASLGGCTTAPGESDPAVADVPVPASPSPTPQAEGGPADRSGDLGQEDLPHPSALGERWKYRVDPGDPEEGYQGSGEPAIARKPSSVLAAITPLGCRPQPLPEPTHALEVTYRRGAIPGVGLILEFATPAGAQRFFTVHRAVLEQCEDASRVDLDVLSSTSDTMVSARTEQLGQTPSWVEGVRRTGDTVTFVAVSGPRHAGVRAVQSALLHP